MNSDKHTVNCHKHVADCKCQYSNGLVVKVLEPLCSSKDKSAFHLFEVDQISSRISCGLSSVAYPEGFVHPYSGFGTQTMCPTKGKHAFASVLKQHQLFNYLPCKCVSMLPNI